LRLFNGEGGHSCPPPYLNKVRTKMKISYDSEVDALYIRLLDGQYECRTVRLNNEMALNIGPGEVLVGVEILDAKRILGNGDLPKVMLENVPVVV